MDHSLLRFFLPKDKPFYATDFREALAATNTLPPEFFCYDSATGLPIRQAPRTEEEKAIDRNEGRKGLENAVIPRVRAVGGKGWVGVLAEDRALPMIHAAIAPALEVMNNRYSVPVQLQIETHPLKLKEIHEPRPYYVREMVIKKGAPKGISEDDLKKLIERRIRNSIVAQAASAGLDCPTDEQMCVMVSEVNRPRGIRLVTSHGKTNQFACLVDVRFYANLELLGFWFAGNLTARGYGRIGLNLGEFALINQRRKGQPK